MNTADVPVDKRLVKYALIPWWGVYTHAYLIVQILVNELYHLYDTAVSAWCSTEGTTHLHGQWQESTTFSARESVQYAVWFIQAVCSTPCIVDNIPADLKSSIANPII